MIEIVVVEIKCILSYTDTNYIGTGSQSPPDIDQQPPPGPTSFPPSRRNTANIPPLHLHTSPPPLDSPHPTSPPLYSQNLTLIPLFPSQFNDAKKEENFTIESISDHTEINTQDTEVNVKTIETEVNVEDTPYQSDVDDEVNFMDLSFIDVKPLRIVFLKTPTLMLKGSNCVTS